MSESERVIEEARRFVELLKREPKQTRRGILGPAFQPMTTVTRIAWLSLVSGLIGSNKNYFPIMPERHTVTVGGPEDRHTYTYEERPDIVLSSARQHGLDALRTTLKAEAWAREIAVELDENPNRTEEENHYFRVVSAFANHFAKFHLTAWSIREPASLDQEQREIQAQGVVKRVINHAGGRAPRARAANDFE